jgi:hypothetical protein
MANVFTRLLLKSSRRHQDRPVDSVPLQAPTSISFHYALRLDTSTMNHLIIARSGSGTRDTAAKNSACLEIPSLSSGFTMLFMHKWMNDGQTSSDAVAWRFAMKNAKKSVIYKLYPSTKVCSEGIRGDLHHHST